jgi:hypothetical protein
VTILINIYHTSVWFIFSIILFPTPLPFLKQLPQVSVFHIHTCIESTSTIFTLLYPFHLPSPPDSTFPLARPVLHSCPSLIKYLFIVHGNFFLVILPVNILCLKLWRSNTSTTLPHPCLSILYCSTVFSVFHFLIPVQMWCISILFILYRSFFLFLLP